MDENHVPIYIDPKNSGDDRDLPGLRINFLMCGMDSDCNVETLSKTALCEDAIKNGDGIFGALCDSPIC